MKHLLLTTIAAVVLVGCGESQPDISIYKAAKTGNIEAVKQHLAAGTDVNAKDEDGGTPLHRAAARGHKETAELLIAQGADDSCRSYPCTSWKCGRVGQCSSKPEPSVS
ncbi:uncharacterized protein METZ01_LOCUS357228 [marine metagenome]|uniref:Uncharacterized protein n=1 Tax=marine metagenome TaxID=408172 RepID=A0A382S369_9ZZZZ